MLSFRDVIKARERISKYIYKTPLEKSLELSNEDTNVYLKLENQQRIRCAKARGAFSKITNLSEEEIEKGIVAISSGNHGAAVSYASKLLGIKNVSIYVPETTPPSKTKKIEYYGGNIIKLGENYDECHELAMEEIKKSGKVFIDPCSDEIVISGQGTIAIEILEENPEIDTILVPIGGGGIITGISLAAKAIKPGIKIIGVQTSACPAMAHAMRDKVFYESYPSEESICDALIGGVGYIPYVLSEKYIDEIILVDEKDIFEAVKFLLEKEKLVVEAAGAVTLASLRSNPSRFKGKNLALVLTGGNINDDLLKNILL